MMNTEHSRSGSNGDGIIDEEVMALMESVSDNPVSEIDSDAEVSTIIWIPIAMAKLSAYRNLRIASVKKQCGKDA